MTINEQRRGEFFISASAVLWGFFPIITILSYNAVPPIISFGMSTLFSLIIFGTILSIRGKWSELNNKTARADILWTTVTITVFYLLLFLGLRYTSAGNASIISRSEILSSFLFFHVWRREKIPRAHIVGALCMVTGVLLLLFPNFTGVQRGDLLTLAAVFVAPLGNFFQQRARRSVSSETIMFARAALASPIIFCVARVFGEHISLSALRASLPLLMLNGLFIFGISKIFWIEGIHRIGVTKANALSSISPIITLLFAWVLLGDTPTLWQLLSLIPIFAGVLFLGVQETNSNTLTKDG